MANERKLRPSAADRWIACPGSIYASIGRVSPSSPYAIEGTRAHVHAASEAAQKFNCAYAAEELYEDVDMARHAQTWAKYLSDEMLLWMPCRAGVEESVDLSQVLAVPSGAAGGTVDFYALSDEILLVADYKYGEGVLVHAQGNTQLKLYALGLAHKYGYCGEMTLAVYQPRVSDKLNIWSTSTEVLQSELPALRKAAQEAWESDEKTRRVYGSHCRWCAAKTVCSQGVGDVKAGLVEAFKRLAPVAKNPQASVDELSSALHELCEYQGFVDDLKERVKQALSEGHTSAHWELVARRNKSWGESTEKILGVLEDLGVPAAKATALLSPAKIAKFVSKSKWDSNLESLVEYATSMTLQRIKHNEQ